MLDGEFSGGACMLATRELEIVTNCYKQPFRARRKSDNISSEVVNVLAAFAIPVSLQKGAALFVEGQPSRGAFILYSGRVKLFTLSADGKIFILRFADAGEILGLAGAVSGEPYEAWAETIQPTQIGFVGRSDLVRLMRDYGEFAVQVAMQLGKSYCTATAGLRAMGLSQPASQKLAIFLLDWYERNRSFHDQAVPRFSLTHEEIAQVIGTSRETVTRLLSQFKKKGLIEWNGSNLALTDRAALERSAAN